MKKNKSIFFQGVLFVFMLMLFSCNTEKDSKNDKLSYEQAHAKTFARSLDLKNMKDIQLMPKAKEATSDWSEFMNARAEISKLPSFTLQDIINNSNNLLQSVIALQDSIPEVFQVKPVKSRLTVLLTKAEVLSQISKRARPDAKQIEAHGKEMYKAFGDLEIQLNEVFLKSIEDFEFDLDAREDSIQQVKQEQAKQKKLNLPRKRIEKIKISEKKNP